MRSTISKKQERKPPFFFGVAPPPIGGASPTIRKGRSPDLPTQGQAIPGGERPTPSTETNSELVHVCAKDICQSMLISQIKRADRPPAASRKTEGSYEHLEGDNKRPMGVKHCNRLSDRFPVGTLAKGTTSHSTILCETVEQSHLIVEDVQELLGKGAIVEVHNPRGGFYSNLFLVPKKDGETETSDKPESSEQFCSHRAFQDGGNPYLEGPSQSGGLVGKSGSEGRIFCDPNHKSHHKYLRFMYRGKYYQFQCLPFGLSSAPWVFTKTLKPVLALLREMGVRLIAYIDAMLVLAESQEQAKRHAEAVVYLLQCLGFKINQKISVLEPAQVMEFLGLTVDTVQMELKLPVDNIKKIRAESRAMMREE